MSEPLIFNASVPLIFTTKGNVEIANLEHSVEWQIHPTVIVFTETYKLDGEVVRQSAHAKQLSGTESGATGVQ